MSLYIPCENVCPCTGWENIHLLLMTPRQKVSAHSTERRRKKFIFLLIVAVKKVWLMITGRKSREWLCLLFILILKQMQVSNMWPALLLRIEEVHILPLCIQMGVKGEPVQRLTEARFTIHWQHIHIWYFCKQAVLIESQHKSYPASLFAWFTWTQFFCSICFVLHLSFPLGLT